MRNTETKTQRTTRSTSMLLAAAVAVGAAAMVPATVRATTFTWTDITGGNASGSWNTAVNWNNGSGPIASGTDNTADFSTLDIAANSTVSLDAAQNIGNLIFGDTDTSTAFGWIISTGTGTNVLTLAGTSPTITVNAMSSVNNTGSNVTISATIDGTGGLTKNGTGTNSSTPNNTAGTGTLTLSGVNTYTGATNINTGTIRVTNSSAFGGVAGGKLTTNVVNVADGARLLIGSGITLGNTVNLNGVYALALSGGANASLSGTVNLQSNSSAYIHNGGNNNLTFSGTVALSSYVLAINTTGINDGASITGTLTGGTSGGITKNGSGPLTISADGSGYSGTTTITGNGGEIRLGSDTALGTSAATFAMAPSNNGSVTVRSADTTNRTIAAAVTMGNGISSTFDFGTSTTGNLTFTNTTAIALPVSRSFTVNNAQTQFDAGFTGNGFAITKNGTGTLVINGNSNYTGATTITVGTMLMNGSDSGTSGATVSSGATLGGVGSINTAATTNFSSGGTFLAQIAGSLDVGTLDATGGTIATADTLTLPSYTVMTFTAIDGGAEFTVDPSISSQGYSVSYLNNSVVLQSAAVPEPASLALLALGGLALLRRRR